MLRDSYDLLRIRQGICIAMLNRPPCRCRRAVGRLASWTHSDSYCVQEAAWLHSGICDNSAPCILRLCSEASSGRLRSYNGISVHQALNHDAQTCTWKLCRSIATLSSQNCLSSWNFACLKTCSQLGLLRNGPLGRKFSLAAALLFNDI